MRGSQLAGFRAEEGLKELFCGGTGSALQVQLTMLADGDGVVQELSRLGVREESEIGMKFSGFSGLH
jgi:hypothetical protein